MQIDKWKDKEETKVYFNYYYMHKTISQNFILSSMLINFSFSMETLPVIQKMKSIGQPRKNIHKVMFQTQKFVSISTTVHVHVPSAHYNIFSSSKMTNTS